MQYKIPNLIEKQNKNDASLSTKSSSLLQSKVSSEFISTFKSIYDSGWINSINEEIVAATTQVEELPLPEKASYNFIFSLNVPEPYLPFINLQLFTKPLEQQSVVGANQFTYTSLKEVIIHLYEWKGTTQIIGALLPSTRIRTDGGTLPPKPAITYNPPPPSNCYIPETFYSAIYIDAGSGATYTLSHDGLLCNVNGVWYATSAVIANWISIWQPEDGKLWVTYYFGQSQTFAHDPINFPVPDDGESLLPCGGTDPDQYSTPEYPNQYWEQQAMVTFQEYMDLTGKSYADAVEVFTEYYPNIYITPFSHGAPFKAYKRIVSEVVESAKQTIQITKLDDNHYQYNVRGYLLLVSPSITETSWSDPDFPTYMPHSDPLSICLRAYLRGHPINFIQTKAYKQ